MPYKRSYRKKTGYRKKKGSTPWYNRKYSPYQLARKAWDGVWKLKGLVNSELHKAETTNTTTAVNTGVVAPMAKVAVGDTYTDRTGNSIFVRSLNIKGYCALGASETKSIVRIAVVIDTQQISDTNPSFTDIYQIASVNTHLNPDTVGRFKVLHDKVINLDTSQKSLYNFEINLPMRHHIRYNGIANTDLQKGALYLCYISEQYTTNAPVFVYDARLSFHDN